MFSKEITFHHHFISSFYWAYILYAQIGIFQDDNFYCNYLTSFTFFSFLWWWLWLKAIYLTPQ